MTKIDENSRVKLPALVHLTRIGYQYLSKNGVEVDTDTNIFIDIFRQSVNKINSLHLHNEDVKKMIDEIKLVLSSDDLGKGFYRVLLNGLNGIKLIEFDAAKFSTNTFQCVTELTYKNGSDEFRPDITVLINGIPISFIEVKKPNNKDGIQAEYTRMTRRNQNKKFQRFLNLTQIMVFSNNTEYDDTEVVPLSGAFYTTTSYSKALFNRFREEDESILKEIKAVNTHHEDFILKDNNYVSIKGTAEYKTNLDPLSPTNRILTSLFSHERIRILLKYAIAYVEKTNDDGISTLEKHIIRYPQLFATKAIETTLSAGLKKGIIWHTQGSGKTALAFYNIRYLKDYYQKKCIIAKFYFIVDRLDLMTQAADEFRARGLYVEEVNSKEDFIDNIKATGQSNNTGQDAITVVNIQKFSAESIIKNSDYNVNIQRIYFLDEAHRSYNPKGSFLSNLKASDRNAVMVALTGTPLIGTVYEDGKPVSTRKYDTKDVFGEYIHKYYYNRSIADGYTLKLIREGIETTYRQKLQTALDEIVLKGSFSREELYAHPKYVKELVKYILDDFNKSRVMLNDDSIGGMIICDSSKQAKAVFKELQDTNYKSALILHDVDDTDIRRTNRNSFKKGTLDFLVVYNMLLTGFDSARLKKLYLGRVIRDHSLLQALTRVNRPYKGFRYGYVVDFADIRKEFDKTNKAYFDELQAELGDAFKEYDNIFKTPEDIVADLCLIKEKLFLYDTSNVEIFSKQISTLDGKLELIELRKAFALYKELFNVAKLYGYNELVEHFSLENVNMLYAEVNNRIDLINRKDTLKDAEDMSAVLNLALEDIDFHFKKVSESELTIADSFREALEKTRKEMQSNLDPKDPEYVSILEELQRLLKKKNIEELTATEMKDYMDELEHIRKLAAKLNHADQMLAHKYNGDCKYMRTHKRIKENSDNIISDIDLHNILSTVKDSVDNTLLANEHLLDNESYFTASLFPVIKNGLTEKNITPTAQQIHYISEQLSSEYITERTYAYQ